jgi:hypothetical protein
MRSWTSLLFFVISSLAASPVLGQYSPRLSSGLEFGPELILADDRLSLSGAFQTPLGRKSDIRAAIGIEDPDVASSSAVLSGSMRALLSDVTPGKILTSMQGQLDFFFGAGHALRLTGGPGFGLATGVDGSFLPYAQPLFLYFHQSGKNDVKLGVRFGADYAMKPNLDMRGDLIISSFLQLRAALALHIGPRLFGKDVPPPPPPRPEPAEMEEPGPSEEPSDKTPSGEDASEKKPAHAKEPSQEP